MGHPSCSPSVTKCDPFDSRFLSRLGQPTGRLNAELPGVLGVQSLPAFELHGIGVDDAADGSLAQKAIQNSEINVHPGGAPPNEEAIGAVLHPQATAAT